MSQLCGKNEPYHKYFLLKLMPILFIYKKAVSGENSVVEIKFKDMLNMKKVYCG